MIGRGMRKDQLVQLARDDVDRGADRIERLYGWEVERLLTVVRAALALAGSILGVAVAALFEENAPAALWQIHVATTALGASLGAVVFLYTRPRRLVGNYLESPR